MSTWEEMMVTIFVQIPTHLFHPSARPLQMQYISLKKASNTIAYKQHDLTQSQQARRQELHEVIEKPWWVDSVTRTQSHTPRTSQSD